MKIGEHMAGAGGGAAGGEQPQGEQKQDGEGDKKDEQK